MRNYLLLSKPMTTTRILSKIELVKKLSLIGDPKINSLSQNDVDQLVADFCAGCPDPFEAYRLIAECLDPLTDEQLVDRALSMSLRPIAYISRAIVPAEHPARMIDDLGLVP